MDEKLERVDFTPNRLFSKKSFIGMGSSIAFDPLWYLSKKFPWSVTEVVEVKSDADMDASLELFFTGSVKEITLKKAYTQMQRGQVCECCGSEIKRFAWNESGMYGLCDKCSDNLFKAYEKYPWEMEKETSRNTVDSEKPWWFHL